MQCLLFADAKYGVLPLITGTLVVTACAALIALPMGLFGAIYLSEYARSGVRKVLKPILEILAGIPLIVYGYFAVTFITPMLRGTVTTSDEEYAPLVYMEDRQISDLKDVFWNMNVISHEIVTETIEPSTSASPNSSTPGNSISEPTPQIKKS